MGSKMTAGLPVLTLVIALAAVFAGTSASEDTYVTCGSVIKLRNAQLKTKISCKEATYGGEGSGQNAITGLPSSSVPGTDSYWTVRSSIDNECTQGDVIEKNSKIRLQNLQYGKWLHSHRFRSMLSQDKQEVSCFGSQNESDESDIWIVSWSSSSLYWKKGEKVYLKHIITGAYLSGTPRSYPRPLQGELEIAGERSLSSSSQYWIAEEGIYFPQKEDKLDKLDKAGAADKNERIHSEL